jgi:hypothetical protein
MGIPRHVRFTPGSDRTADIAACPFRADIVAKVFLGGERKFSEPLMRFPRGDVRDHIVSSKIDH